METKKIYGAICKVMQGINAIGKNNTNYQQRFNYRSVDDVMNELHTLLAKNNVFIVPEVLEAKKETAQSKSGGTVYQTMQKIKFTFFADDGSSIEAIVVGEANDSGDKGSNKALSIAFKYVCLQVFCIPTDEDKDPDAHSWEVQNNNRKTKTKPAAEKKEAPVLKGGETTEEEKSYIRELLSATTEAGEQIFTKEQKREFLKMRTELTAAELIKKIEGELGIKPEQSLQKLYEPKPATPEQKAAEVFSSMQKASEVKQPAEAPQQPQGAPNNTEQEEAPTLSFDEMQPAETQPEVAPAANKKPDIF